MNTILNLPICKIQLTKEGYVVLIKMKSGQWLEHCPFPADERGTVAALLLAADVCAGKFYPSKIVDSETPKLIGFKKEEN
mgnify:CR=1 FL=1